MSDNELRTPLGTRAPWHKEQDSFGITLCDSGGLERCQCDDEETADAILHAVNNAAVLQFAEKVRGAIGSVGKSAYLYVDASTIVIPEKKAQAIIADLLKEMEIQ